jgi:hypothetical protein
MTLCIAHKVGPTIFLASDSRVSIKDRFSDLAIKVIPLSISINSARDSETGKTEVLYSSSFGFAFAGNLAAQNAIKDFLSIVLQQLQFIPIFGPLKFEGICSFVMDLYRHVSTKLFRELDETDFEFFLCGTCPYEKTVKIAKFSINYGPSIDKFEPSFVVYETDKDFPLAIGSGEDRFYDEYKKLSSLPAIKRAIQALKNVIDDENIPSVGGNIQYGESHPGRPFFIDGIVVAEFNRDGTPRMNHFYLGGIDVLDDVFVDMNGFHIAGTFIYPFK